jgi:hypothetical protein
VRIGDLMMKRNITIAVFFALVLCLFPAAVFAEWKSDNADGFDFRWRFNGSNLDVELSYAATGWIAVGFDAEKKMKGANIFIGYVDGDKVVIEDHFGNSPVSHKRDTDLKGSNDIINASGSEKNGKTTLSFSIPLNSGDKNDKVLTEGSTYRLIFAASSNDNIKKKHSKRLGKDITL